MRALLFALTVTWDPTIRGIAVVVVGVAVLCGSVYLLLATNTGGRLGFLLALTGFFGWMVIMGVIWWVYGIGATGAAPAWHVVEIHASDDPNQLEGVALEEARTLEGWRELQEGDRVLGDAQAAADEALAGDESDVKVFGQSGDYVLVAGYDKGGKDGGFVSDWVPLPHPAHYAIVQVQARQQVEVPLGETPPPAEPDPSQDVYSVIMERDLGSKRLPPAAMTVLCLVIFVVLVNMLHRRDKEMTAARAAAERGS